VTRLCFEVVTETPRYYENIASAFSVLEFFYVFHESL